MECLCNLLSGPTYAPCSAGADDGVLEAVLDFIADMFKDMLFGLFEILFGIFSLSILANRPLFAAPREKKPTQKVLSTKAEIKSKQLLIVFPMCMMAVAIAPSGPSAVYGCLLRQASFFFIRRVAACRSLDMECFPCL